MLSVDLLFMEKGVMFVFNITSLRKWWPSYVVSQSSTTLPTHD